MPLTELMNYFNDQLQIQRRHINHAKAGFFKANNTYWARFGNLIMGSQFSSIRAIHNDDLLGQYADLFVRSSTGNILQIESIVNALEDTEQVVFLDRLVRTLHSLNYLQHHDSSQGLLALEVQPRHIVSVASGHGKTFEKILSDCGLGPERVVLHTRLREEAAVPHFHQAFTSYRERGYQLGISLGNSTDWELLKHSGLKADYLFIEPPLIRSTAEENSAPHSRRIMILPEDAHLEDHLFKNNNPLLTGYVHLQDPSIRATPGQESFAQELTSFK